MKLLYKNAILLCWMILMFMPAPGRAPAFAQSDAMIPPGLPIRDAFEPGLGMPVGQVMQVQGKVVLLHVDMSAGYLAEEGLPLFKGDTIITQKHANIRFALNDGSILSLASQTKLVLKRSTYDPDKRNRTSFIRMAVGRARFWVKKLMDFKYASFTVKTDTAVIGVRGSDFVIRAGDNLTEVIALDDTALEVFSSSLPDAPSVMVTDLNRVRVEDGLPPSEPEQVSREIIEKIREELNVVSERDVSAPGTNARKRPDRKQGILVPRGEVVRPEHMPGPEIPGHPAPPEQEKKPAPAPLPPIPESRDILEQNEKIMDERNRVIQDKKELDQKDDPPPTDSDHEHENQNVSLKRIANE